MSTATTAPAIAQDRRVLEVARKTFDEESKVNTKLKPNQVIVLIEDVCIETRCVRAALPPVLRATYEGAARRVRLQESFEYVTHTLMRDVERALDKM